MVNPLLLIDSNELEASHGASVSNIDESKKFYLMSRGLNEKQAQYLYVLAFFEKAFKVMEEGIIEEIKETLERVIYEL